MSLLRFDKRHPGPELMDDPACDPRLLLNTVRQFKLINLLFSSSRRLIKRHIVSRMKPGTEHPYTLLELGAGGGETALWLARYCRKRDINLRISCLDNDPRIAEYARIRSAADNTVEIIEGSVFDLDGGRYDFIYANHFLHHFSSADIRIILDLCRKSCTNLVLLNDLKRSRLSWFGYRLFALLFLHRSFAAYDGSLSIRRGFLSRELSALLVDWGLENYYRIGETAPGRIYLLGSRD